MAFAENLKQIRKEKEISQEELAESLDVSRQVYQSGSKELDIPKLKNY